MHYASRERQKIQKLENLRQKWLEEYHKRGASQTSPLAARAALSLLLVGAVEGKGRSEDEQHKLDKAVAEVLGREHNKDKLELFLQVIGARVIELRHLSVNVRSCGRVPKHFPLPSTHHLLRYGLCFTLQHDIPGVTDSHSDDDQVAVRAWLAYL